MYGLQPFGLHPYSILGVGEAGGDAQNKRSSASASQMCTTAASTSSLNSQQQSIGAIGAQAFNAVATANHVNDQQQNATAIGVQAFRATAKTTNTNSQNRQSSAQLQSVAAFIASTSWINTIDAGVFQHHQTSGSASQSSTAMANALPINSQQHQTTGTANQISEASGQSQAKNNQHKQSTGLLLSVAQFIASTSWTNTIDMGNAQHHQTSGSAVQIFSAAAHSTAKNSQQRKTDGQSTSANTFVATNSWINTVLLIAVYTRHIKTRSISRKNLKTSTRHSYHIKSGSTQ